MAYLAAKCIMCSLPCSKVDLDVDKDHDAGGDVEGAKGGVEHVADVFAELRK